MSRASSFNLPFVWLSRMKVKPGVSVSILAMLSSNLEEHSILFGDKERNSQDFWIRVKNNVFRWFYFVTRGFFFIITNLYAYTFDDGLTEKLCCYMIWPLEHMQFSYLLLLLIVTIIFILLKKRKKR